MYDRTVCVYRNYRTTHMAIRGDEPLYQLQIFIINFMPINQSINQSINQYVFSAPSTQVRADEALQMSSQYTYS